MFIKIFKLITCNIWNGKKKIAWKRQETTHAKNSQPIQHYRNSSSYKQRTSTRKFLPEGTFHKITREVVKEQCRKEFLCLKLSLQINTIPDNKRKHNIKTNSKKNQKKEPSQNQQNKTTITIET